MDKRLQILITAGINQGLSIGEINRGLKELAKHPSLQKLKVGIEIDQSLLNQVTKLSSELSKATQLLREQSGATDNVKKSVDGAKSSIQAEVDAIQNSNKALAENLAMRQRIQQKIDEEGRTREDIYTTVGNRFDSKTTHGVRFDGGAIATNPDEFTRVLNPEALREAQEQLQVFTDDANRRIQMLSRTFGESSEEVNKLRNSLSQLTPGSRADFSKVTNQIKELEQSQKLLDQAYKENATFDQKRQKEIDSVRNRISNLTGEVQKFNRAGKELPVGKGKEFDKLLDSLKKIDTTNISKANQELDKLEKTFNRLDKTAGARTGLLSKLNNMKATGVINENEISNLENRIRKAESPEQIQRLAKEYGSLVAQQTKILQVDQKKIPLMNQIQEMKERGLLTEKEIIGLENQVAEARTRNHIRLANETRQRLTQKENAIKSEMDLERRNVELQKKLLLDLRRLEINPQARKSKERIQEFRNELLSLNATAPMTNQRLREIQHSLRAIGVEAQGAGIKTNTILGAFQNALVNILPPSTVTY